MSECVYFITGLRCALSYEMKPHHGMERNVHASVGMCDCFAWVTNPISPEGINELYLMVSYVL